MKGATLGAVLALIASGARADAGAPASVEVRDVGGRLIGDARVRVWVRMGIPAWDERTNKSGFVDGALVDGTHHLRVEADGFFENDSDWILTQSSRTARVVIVDDVELRTRRRRELTSLRWSTAVAAGVVGASALLADNVGGRAIAIGAGAVGGTVAGMYIGSELGQTGDWGSMLSIGAPLGFLAGVLGATFATDDPGSCRPVTTAIALVPLLLAHAQGVHERWHRTPAGDLR